MRSTLSASRLLSAVGTALIVTLAAGCGNKPEPIPDPVPVVSPQPVAAPTPPAPPAPVRQEPGLLDIVVHQADLHGHFEGMQGSTISIRALLKMSKTQPAVGNKGVLYWAPTTAQGDADWVELGDVEVKKALDGEGRMEVRIRGDEKKFMMQSGKRSTPLVKKTRLRLRWEW